MDFLRRNVPWLPFGLSAYRLDRLLFGTLVVVVLAIFPYIDSNSSHVSALADAGYVLLLAFGLNVVVGYTGLLALGYAAFFAIGAYTYAIVASPQFGLHYSFWIMLFVSAIAAAAFGV